MKPIVTLTVIALLALLALLVPTVSAQTHTPLDHDTGEVKESAEGRSYSPYAGRTYPTRVFFGDTHHHTANSGDAFMLAYPVCCQSYYRVSPLAAVECLVGRCRGMCRNSHDRVERGHWIETPVEAEHKFVEVSL